jgi:hypothetical protein
MAKLTIEDRISDQGFRFVAMAKYRKAKGLTRAQVDQMPKARRDEIVREFAERLGLA